MRVLAMASQKGGSGKTTLSGHLAVQAQLAGAGPVCLIDIDPQGSRLPTGGTSARPTCRRSPRPPSRGSPPTSKSFASRASALPSSTRRRRSPWRSRASSPVAELIVIPTRPSPHDLRAVGATVDLCDRAGKPLLFVVNGATPKAKITYEAAVALSQHGTVAPVTLHHRTDFAASMIDGRTVMEVDPNGRSAREVIELWDYISDRLEKNFRRTVFAAPGAAAADLAASSRWLRPPRGRPVRGVRR